MVEKHHPGNTDERKKVDKKTKQEKTFHKSQGLTFLKIQGRTFKSLDKFFGRVNDEKNHGYRAGPPDKRIS